MAKVLDRKEIEEQYKWSTESMFATDAAWEDEFAQVKEIIESDEFEGMRGHLQDGPELVLDYLEKSEEVGRRLGVLHIYAHMKNDQDTREQKYQAMLSRVQMIGAVLSEQTSFFEPELLSLPQTLLDSYVNSEALHEFRHLMENIVRHKQHILSSESEALLASLSDVLGSEGDVFGLLTNADFDHGDFTVDGEEYKVTEGRLGLLFRNPNREVRKLAYERVYDTYLSHKNAIAGLYANNVKTDVALARTKKFNSAREMALFSNHIPESVYNALIKGVHDNIAHHHRYLELRKKVMKLDGVRLYDKYVPLAEEEQKHYSFEEGFALVQKGLGALGNEYGEILKKAVSERWIDVYENAGKRSGAYSTGFYATKPYILLNYQGEYDSVSTLAHELGHSMHSYLTGHTQPPHYAHYSIFLAEIASTVNETLLVNYLLETTEDPKLRASLINQQLDTMTGTIYRQTMFAEFEWRAHRMVEEGHALTHDSLSELYGTINAEYHGPAFVTDERSPAEWSRIPHFYRSFYVFQYATGMSAALAFAERIRSGGPDAVEKYLGFLRSGAKDYPLEVLKEAGVDMTDPSVVTQGLKIYGELLAEFEKLLA